MASRLWAVSCQRPPWLLTRPRPKCHLTWPTARLLLVMLLDTGGNMPVAPHFPPTTVTFPHRWRSRGCRQPEKVVTLSPPPLSDGRFRPQQPHPAAPAARPPPPALQPFCLESWLYGLTSFVLMTLNYFLPWLLSHRKPDRTLEFENKSNVKDWMRHCAAHILF